MKDLVSIVMPSYNCGNFIEESIQSVIKQTYPYWELIIVDDCSKDNTSSVVEPFTITDPRVKYIRLEENAGAATARNIGMRNSTGKYIAFLDSDDLWMEEKLERQLAYMEKNKYNFTCTKYSQIDEDGNDSGIIIDVKDKVDYNSVLYNNTIGNSTVIFNAEKLGQFEVPNIRKRNDVALWLRILKKEKYAYGMDEVLMRYRVRRNSISSNKFDLIKYHWYLYREIEKLSIPKSTKHLAYWAVIKLLKRI